MRSPLLAARTAQAIADQVGTDRVPAEVTAMHHAHLYNYLGIPDISGTDFQRNARRHAAEHGATLDDVQVTAIDRDDEAFTVRTNGGADAVADYLVTAGGKASRRLAVDLGLTLESGGSPSTMSSVRTSTGSTRSDGSCTASP